VECLCAWYVQYVEVTGSFLVLMKANLCIEHYITLHFFPL
jgi:hypothetical protein